MVGPNVLTVVLSTGVNLLDLFCTDVKFNVLLGPCLCTCLLFVSWSVCFRKWCVCGLRVRLVDHEADLSPPMG